MLKRWDEHSGEVRDIAIPDLSTGADTFGPMHSHFGGTLPPVDIATMDPTVRSTRDGESDLKRVRGELELLMSIRNNNGLNPAWAACYQLLCQREVDLLKTARSEGART